MKKYFLKTTKEEVKVGSKIQLQKKVNTSYGEGTLTTDVVVTEEILKKLLAEGFVDVQEEDNNAKDFEALKPYIRRFGRKNDLNFPESCMALQGVLSMSPKAHLVMLAEIIAEVKNKGKQQGSTIYCLNPLRGFKPSQIVGNPVGSVVFYDLEGVREAYLLLLPFIKDLLGDGE